MGIVRDRMVRDLALAGYADDTRRVYLSAATELVVFHGRSPEELDREDVRVWVEHLLTRGLSTPRIGQHFAALRFLFGKTLGRPHAVSFLTRPKGIERLPVVLSVGEVGRLLDALVAPQLRTFFTLVYATGLRISEACRLEIRDIHTPRGVIHVRHGKGRRKERFVTLTPRLLAILRAHWRAERPLAPWLFASRTGNHLNGDVARIALARAAVNAKLAKKATPHLLRHCFATHLLESGTDLRIIQVLLGHASIASTTKYARVSVATVANARSPLDLLPAQGETG